MIQNTLNQGREQLGFLGGKKAGGNHIQHPVELMILAVVMMGIVSIVTRLRHLLSG